MPVFMLYLNNFIKQLSIRFLNNRSVFNGNCYIFFSSTFLYVYYLKTYVNCAIVKYEFLSDNIPFILAILSYAFYQQQYDCSCTSCTRHQLSRSSFIIDKINELKILAEFYLPGLNMFE